jgi:hypothetical protein
MWYGMVLLYHSQKVPIHTTYDKVYCDMRFEKPFFLFGYHTHYILYNFIMVCGRIWYDDMRLEEAIIFSVGYGMVWYGV